MRYLTVICAIMLIVLALHSTAATSQTPTGTPTLASTADCIRANPTTTPQPTSLVSSGLATMTALAPFSPVPPPEIQGTAIPLDAMGATVTALVQQATQQTQSAFFTPLPTIDPFLQMPMIDPNVPYPFQTATAIVRGATAAVLGYMPSAAASSVSLTPSPTLDPTIAGTATAEAGTRRAQNYMTASAIVAGATELVRGTPSASPRPTQPPPDIDALRARWQAELVARTGLSPDVFEYYLNSLAETVMRITTNSERNWWTADEFDCLRPIVETATIGGEDYVALLLPHNFVAMELMVLRGSGGQMRQIWLVWVPIIYPFGGLEPFGDRNANGYPDIVVTGGTGGNCFWQEFQLLEFRPGDVVVDLIPPDDDIYVRTMVDLNNDGVQELELQFYADVPNQSTACSSARLVRYYGWDGSAYVDISPTLNQSYWPAINQFWADLLDDAVCLLPDRGMADMLLGYEAMGRFEEGWTRLQPRLQWDACPPFTPMTSFQLDNMARLLFWVGERLD